MGCLCESKNNQINQSNQTNQSQNENKNKEFDSGKMSNYIIGEIDINDNNVNKEIMIINSYEEYHRNWGFKPLEMNKLNEEEIKSCKIRIDGVLIPFNYVYTFHEKKNYTIIYTFENDLTNTNFMFHKCECLTKLDFSHLNTQNVKSMEGMFNDCVSLKSLNLSNLNTQNVTNMNHMFYGCESLTNLDLSSFDTRNTTIMYSMFEKCKSLTYLNISTFNAEKVDLFDMEDMFGECFSLANQNIITNDEKIKYVIQYWK